MKKFTNFIEENISGGFTYSDDAPVHHKAAKAAAYEAYNSLNRRNIKIKDHNAFINDIHALIKKHTKET